MTMPRYRLRTLLIILAIGPPLAAAIWSAERAEEFADLGATLWGIGLLAIPVLIAAFVAARFADAVTGRR